MGIKELLDYVYGRDVSITFHTKSVQELTAEKLFPYPYFLEEEK